MFALLVNVFVFQEFLFRYRRWKIINNSQVFYDLESKRSTYNLLFAIILYWENDVSPTFIRSFFGRKLKEHVTDWAIHQKRNSSTKQNNGSTVTQRVNLSEGETDNARKCRLFSFNGGLVFVNHWYYVNCLTP